MDVYDRSGYHPERCMFSDEASLEGRVSGDKSSCIDRLRRAFPRTQDQPAILPVRIKI